MKAKGGKQKAELKVTRGYSLSPENLMALKAEAFERSLAREDGGTVTPSAVLDEIVTEWRTKKALVAAGGVAVPVIVAGKKGRKG